LLFITSLTSALAYDILPYPKKREVIKMGRVKLQPLAIATILLTVICIALLAFSIFQTIKVTVLQKSIDNLKSDVKIMLDSFGELKEVIGKFNIENIP
jgi:hypothetical protein